MNLSKYIMISIFTISCIICAEKKRVNRTDFIKLKDMNYNCSSVNFGYNRILLPSYDEEFNLHTLLISYRLNKNKFNLNIGFGYGRSILGYTVTGYENTLRNYYDTDEAGGEIGLVITNNYLSKIGINYQLNNKATTRFFIGLSMHYNYFNLLEKPTIPEYSSNWQPSSNTLVYSTIDFEITLSRRLSIEVAYMILPISTMEFTFFEHHTDWMTNSEWIAERKTNNPLDSKLFNINFSYLIPLSKKSIVLSKWDNKKPKVRAHLDKVYYGRNFKSIVSSEDHYSEDGDLNKVIYYNTFGLKIKEENYKRNIRSEWDANGRTKKYSIPTNQNSIFWGIEYLSDDYIFCESTFSCANITDEENTIAKDDYNYLITNHPPPDWWENNFNKYIRLKKEVIENLIFNNQFLTAVNILENIEPFISDQDHLELSEKTKVARAAHEKELLLEREKKEKELLLEREKKEKELLLEREKTASWKKIIVGGKWSADPGWGILYRIFNNDHTGECWLYTEGEFTEKVSFKWEIKSAIYSTKPETYYYVQTSYLNSGQPWYAYDSNFKIQYGIGLYFDYILIDLGSLDVYKK